VSLSPSEGGSCSLKTKHDRRVMLKSEFFVSKRRWHSASKLIKIVFVVCKIKFGFAVCISELELHMRAEKEHKA
jgi:hypothetical protein